MKEKILEIYYDELSTITIEGKHGIYEPKIIENAERLAERIVELYEKWDKLEKQKPDTHLKKW